MTSRSGIPRFSFDFRQIPGYASPECAHDVRILFLRLQNRLDLLGREIVAPFLRHSLRRNVAVKPRSELLESRPVSQYDRFHIFLSFKKRPERRLQLPS